MKFSLHLFVLMCLTICNACYAVPTNALIHNAPYKDFTLKVHWDQSRNGLAPESLTAITAKTQQKHFILAFVTATGANTCEAAWGGFPDYVVKNAWGMQEIKELRQQKGDVTIAFGGQAGVYLAKACTDENILVNAYQNVINTYKVTALDFDVEGANLADNTMVVLQANAIAQLQQANPGLKIRYTLPVLPSGLTQDGLNLLKQAQAAGVHINQINIMAMDYGDTQAPASFTMSHYAKLAATSVHTQLAALFSQMSDQALWKIIAVTPMIGVNDVNTEVFTLNDLHDLLNFSDLHSLGAIDLWSADRDHPCQTTYAQPTCSGAYSSSDGLKAVQTEAYAFTKLLN